MRIRLFTLLLACFSFFQPCFGMENSFYILHGQKELSPSLSNHFRSIDILISQAYHINAEGDLSGFIDPHTLEFAKKHSMKVMALVTNSNFDKDKLHLFLSDPEAQINAIQSVLEVCKENHFYGVQFDFENVSLQDRDALTQFYQGAAKALHAKGYVVSFAVVPVTAGSLESPFLKRKYQNWGGAYDLKALGQAADFISVMTYDQHTHGTIPGPTASISWVNSAIQYTLQFVPAKKVSLGIPVYSDYWFTGSSSNDPSGRITTNLAELSYKEVKSLLTKYRIKLRWDPYHKVHYAIYEHAWLNEYIFTEDAESFKAKLALAKKYHLHGISVFSLGNEDPRIWNTLAAE